MDRSLDGHKNEKSYSKGTNVTRHDDQGKDRRTKGFTESCDPYNSSPLGDDDDRGAGAGPVSTFGRTLRSGHGEKWRKRERPVESILSDDSIESAERRRGFDPYNSTR